MDLKAVAKRVFVFKRKTLSVWKHYQCFGKPMGDATCDELLMSAAWHRHQDDGNLLWSYIFAAVAERTPPGKTARACMSVEEVTRLIEQTRRTLLMALYKSSSSIEFIWPATGEQK